MSCDLKVQVEKPAGSSAKYIFRNLPKGEK
jgi:hypothetical protein